MAHNPLKLGANREALSTSLEKIDTMLLDLYNTNPGTANWGALTDSLVPNADVTYDLGSDTKRWRDLYLSGNTIDLGGLVISNTSGDLELSGGIKLPIGGTITDGNGDPFTSGTTLPDQAGQNGKYLTTDGSTLSWATVTSGSSYNQSLNTTDAVTFASATSGYFYGPDTQSTRIVTRNIGQSITKTWSFSTNGVLTLPVGGDIVNSSGSSVINTSVPNTFSTIAVSGQSSVVADTSADTLTLIAGSGISLTTNATNDSITIANTSSVNSFSTIAVSGQSNVIADSSADTLTFVAGTGISITTNASGDSITITNTVSGGGGGGAISSRGAVNGTSASLANGATGSIDITGFKGYALYKIETSAAAWVRLYTSDAARTADASRLEGADPAVDAGVITEVITTGASTVIIAPGVFGFNDEASPTTTIPIAVTNKSGSTAAITVTLTILQLEA